MIVLAAIWWTGHAAGWKLLAFNAVAFASIFKREIDRIKERIS